MRCALYVRCSTSEQDTENQLAQLRQWAESQGWEVVRVYEDYATGKNSAREQLQAMFVDAEHKRFDCLCFWALDRLTREGPLKTLLHLERLSNAGIKVKSFTEPWLDTTTAMGELLAPIVAWVGKQERIRISERTKAGLQTARRKGKVLGRPKLVVDRQRIAELHNSGLSVRQIAAGMGCSSGFVHKTLRHFRSICEAVITTCAAAEAVS
jgi:putative DNA-invertase from lambdoid prophage Rac